MQPGERQKGLCVHGCRWHCVGLTAPSALGACGDWGCGASEGQGHRDGALSFPRKGDKQPHRGEWKPSASQGGAGAKGGSIQPVGDFLPGPRMRPNTAPGAPSAAHGAVCPPMWAQRHCTLPARIGAFQGQTAGRAQDRCPRGHGMHGIPSAAPSPGQPLGGTHISDHHRDAPRCREL